MKKTHTLLLALFLCLALIFPCALAEDAYVPGQRTQALIDAALDAGQVVGGETRLTLQLGDEILSMLADDEESQAQLDALMEVIGGIRLDDNAKIVTVDGDTVSLTPKEYDILRFLMQNAGTVFSPSEIYRRVWDDVPLNATGAIAVHIRHLREKLEINPSDPRYIKVVWGKGYKMEERLT